jgi:serralysin
MPAPDTTSASVAVTDPAGSQPRATEIAALTSSYQWGSVTGAGVTLSYSFPWASSTQAVFSGPGGSAYSAQGEDQAAQRYGLNAVQQGAAASALRVWAEVANLSFVQVADTGPTPTFRPAATSGSPPPSPTRPPRSGRRARATTCR